MSIERKFNWGLLCHWQSLAGRNWEFGHCLCRKPCFQDSSEPGHHSKWLLPMDSIYHCNKCFLAGNMSPDNQPNCPDMTIKSPAAGLDHHHLLSRLKRFDDMIYYYKLKIPRDFMMEYKFKDNLGFFSQTSDSRLQTMFWGQQ